GFGMIDARPARGNLDGTSAGEKAIFFKPAAALSLPAPSEQGTPLPKDEPFAENPPTGAIIDYYLKSAPGAPVVLEIVDAAGNTVRRVATGACPQPREPDTPPGPTGGGPDRAPPAGA